jgi:hypothetical protein
MKPFDELPEDLKASNRMQAERAAGFLEKVGYRVLRERRKSATRIKLSRKEINLMAEMEHGRWVVERLQSGWRFGPERDPAKKISPYLIPWSKLVKEQRNWDRNAVQGWPRILAEAGLQVRR